MSNSSIRPIDRTLSGATTPGPEWAWEQSQWRSALHFSKLQHYWSLTIRLFSIISRKFVVGGGGFIHRWGRQPTYKSEMNLFHFALKLLRKAWIHPSSMNGWIVYQAEFFSLGERTSLGEGNHWNQTSCKVKLATLVEGDPKAPFSIATTPRCRGERKSFPWIASFYPWSIPYNVEC